MARQSNGIGDFTKFQRVTVTPADRTQLNVSHNLGATPKLVILYVVDGSVGSNISDGVFTDQHGAAMISDQNPYAYRVNTDGSTESSNGYAYLTDVSVRITQYNSARGLSTSATYAVDIYA